MSSRRDSLGVALFGNGAIRTFDIIPAKLPFATALHAIGRDDAVSGQH